MDKLEELLKKNPEAKEKGEKVRKALVKIQIPLGLFALAIAILHLIMYFSYYGLMSKI